MNDLAKKNSILYYIKLLGPGLLFAGAAVGVSHLYLATNTGAVYGAGLLWVLILANVIKYPFFEFGSRYSAATGETILEGYQKMGEWVLYLFIGITVVSMIAIQSAVTIVTASLLSYFFEFEMYSTLYWSIIVLMLSAVILAVGRYAVLNNIMKVVIILLTVASVIAVVLAMQKNSAAVPWSPTSPFNDIGIVLFVGLMGWMPGPIDLSVWNSLWTVQKIESGEKLSTDQQVKNAVFDFNVGYIGTGILAICFLLLGAYVMYNSGEELSGSASGFAKQLIEMYTETLGSSFKWFIGIAAITTMFSTTFTCLDALPRSMANCTELLLNQNEQSSKVLDDSSKRKLNPKRYYFTWLVVLIVLTTSLLAYFVLNNKLEVMGVMVKIATAFAFFTAPIFAIANYRLVTGKLLNKRHHPKKWLKVLSIIGIFILTAFAVFYIWYLF